MAPRRAAAQRMPAQQLEPEQLGDVEEGFVPEPTEVDELGLTAEEREQFDGMRDADTGLPEAPEEPAEEGEDEPGGGQQAPAVAAPAPAPPTKKPVPEPEEDDEPDITTRDPRTGKEQRIISYGKHQRLLKRERDAAEALRAQNEETRIQQARLSERLQILNDALTTPQPKTPQELEQERQQQIAQNPMLEATIDPTVDIGAAINQVQRRQEYLQQAGYQQQQTLQEQLEYQNLQRDFSRDTQMYSQTEEGKHFFGLDGAYQHLKNSRLVELARSEFRKNARDENVQFTPQELQYLIAMYNEEEKSLIQDAIEAGESPAAEIMWHAQARGWRPPSPAAAAAAPAPQAPSPRAGAAPRRQMPIPPGAAQTMPRQPAMNGAAARAAQAAPAPRSAVAQIQSERAGALASRSLSDGGGVPPGLPLTLEQLADMDDEEFGIYVDNLPPHQLQAIMGRDFPDRR